MQNFVLVASFLVLGCATNFSSAGIFGSLFHRDPDWSTLRVTWGVNIARDHVFTKMPLKVKKAEEKGYVKVNPSATCSGKFLGTRYVKTEDPAIVMLYDHNGYFAGIQSHFPKPATSPNAFTKSDLFLEDEINGVATYALTAYLVDPDIICTTGRSKPDYDNQKAGNVLYFQNGPNPLKNYLKVPLHENETSAMHWTRGRCFPSMGVHYWYNTSKEMDCDDLTPFFLLYNHAKLTGFGWGIQEKLDSSKHFEHPDKDNLDRFFDSKPKCLKDLYDKNGNDAFTTMHIYMNAKPWNLIC